MATDRITNARLAAALAYLARALDGAGFPLPDGVTLAVRAPYGPCMYVVSEDDAGHYAHDVPGFMYETGGFLSKREAYDSIQRAARTLVEITPGWSRKPFDGVPYRHQAR